MLKKVFLLEKQKEIKLGLKLMKEIKISATANDNWYEIDETQKRLKSKKELLFPKKKVKTKKEKPGKKKKKVI
jgi:hypothetical protein